MIRSILAALIESMRRSVHVAFTTVDLAVADVTERQLCWPTRRYTVALYGSDTWVRDDDNRQIVDEYVLEVIRAGRETAIELGRRTAALAVAP